MSKRKILGKWGENLARQYFLRQNYTIIAQNFYCPYGELDLVVQKGQKIKLIEVKTRKNHNFGWAEESINDLKLNKMAITYQYLQKQKKLPDFYDIELFIIELKPKIKIIRYKL